MSNFTFLERNEIFGSNGANQLDIFKTIGTKAAITDFAITLGGYVSSYHTGTNTSLDTRTGYWWTRTDDGDNDARVVDYLVWLTSALLICVLVVVVQLYRSLKYQISLRTE